jgi:hypothetical protein
MPKQQPMMHLLLQMKQMLLHYLHLLLLVQQKLLMRLR